MYPPKWGALVYISFTKKITHPAYNYFNPNWPGNFFFGPFYDTRNVISVAAYENISLRISRRDFHLEKNFDAMPSWSINKPSDKARLNRVGRLFGRRITARRYKTTLKMTLPVTWRTRFFVNILQRKNYIPI